MRYVYSIFAFFSVTLVYMAVIYVDKISHFGLSVCFLQIKKYRRVLESSLIFHYSTKRIKETVIKFCINNEIKLNVQCDPGCPSTSTTDENIEAVKKMILKNLRITITEVADDVGISFGACLAFFY